MGGGIITIKHGAGYPAPCSVSMIRFGERTAFPDALIVLGRITADDLMRIHLHAEVLFYKVDGGEDGEERIPLAASGPADLADAAKRACGHLVGESERLHGQGRGLGDDGDEHTRADPRPARAPEATGAAGDVFAAVHHLHQGTVQADIAAGVFIGGQQRGADHHVMLRPVHMAEGHGHHLLDDFDGVLRGLCHAQPDDSVQPLGVAVIAHIVAVDAPGLAQFFFVAYLAFHEYVRFEVLQRRPADQTFFLHVQTSIIRWFLPLYPDAHRSAREERVLSNGAL